MNALDRAIIVAALAQNASPEDATMVLSHALDGLHVEAFTIQNELEAENDISTLLFSHIGRLKALEELFDQYMTATWKEPAAKAEAAE